MRIHEDIISKELKKELSIDCEKCSGLCCIALFFSKMDGFPEDKIAGKPCLNLQLDFSCAIHSKLIEHKMKGCIAYDCFGAGQKVTQSTYKGANWVTEPKKSKEIFEVFLAVYQLHQILWFLAEARTLVPAKALWETIDKLIEENHNICELSPPEINMTSIEEYRSRVNEVLKKISELVNIKCSHGRPKEGRKNLFGRNFKDKNLDGADFSMSLLIASNFEGSSLCGTNFLGADMRDTNLKGADLSESIFLTQSQINSAKGNSNTKLPAALMHPSSWN